MRKFAIVWGALGLLVLVVLVSVLAVGGHFGQVSDWVRAALVSIIPSGKA